MSKSGIKASANGNIFEAKGLSVEIEVPAGTLHAVSNINFHVDRGETLCVVGESGCGKSIAMLAIMGLLPRTASLHADSLTLEGTELLTLKEKNYSKLRGNRMGMIFQDPMTCLNPVYTIGNQMEEIFIRHGRGDRKKARRRAEFMLEMVGITGAVGRLGQYPHQLSGGLRQRVMIAMMLMCDPVLIIADEPTTALDVTIQAQILHLLKDLQKEFNMGLILITHDLGVVARIADRLAVMYAGKIVETGTAVEIFSEPLHPYTQDLLKCIPIPGKTKQGAKLGSISGIVPALVGEFTGCIYRNRCAYRMDVCAVNDVKLQQLGPARGFRCLLSEKESLKHVSPEGGEAVQ